MGTRSLTVVRSRWDEGEFDTLAVIYRHWDGYPSQHGKDLLDMLKRVRVVNGLCSDQQDSDVVYCNGPGELAAFIVSEMRAGGNNPSLMTHDPLECGQEFVYRIDVTCGDTIEIEVVVFDGPMTFFGGGGEDCTREIFRGTVEQYGEFISKALASVSG